jgi:hypothetical protein
MERSVQFKLTCITYYTYTGSFTEDFEGEEWVFVEIRRGRSQPEENHINAISIGLRKMFDTSLPVVYIRCMYAPPPKNSKVGGGYL